MSEPAATTRAEDRPAAAGIAPGGAAANIASCVRAAAERYPDKPAIILAASGRTLTFRALQHEIDVCAAGFSAQGLERGDRVLLFVPPSVEFFALTFALFQIGAVPVLIDPGLGATQMARCLTAVQVEGFVGVPKAHVFRLLYRNAFTSLRVRVTVGARLGWGGVTLAGMRRAGERLLRASAGPPIAATAADDPAAILFTSGSTGPAKGVLYTHGNFRAQVDLLESHFGFGPDEIDLPTFPLFALFDAALGMTAVIPRMDFTKPGSVDPAAIWGPLERYGCTHMFGSPALLDRVSAEGVARTPVERLKLRRVLTAGAPVRPDILTRFSARLPADASIYTPYGATESLPIASIGHREVLSETAALTAEGRGVCVGKPIEGIEVRIIGITEEPLAAFEGATLLPAGEIGEIVVSGPVVTGSYVADPFATSQAKLTDARGRLWHRMGDVGYLDENGRLWYCGRKSHRVVTARGTLFTECVEAVFNQHPDVRRTALVGVGKRGQQRPVLMVQRKHPQQATATIEPALRKIAAEQSHLREIDQFIFCLEFPVDVRHNAKIFREKLAAEAEVMLQKSEGGPK